MARELCGICGVRDPACKAIDCPYGPNAPRVMHLTISQRIVRAHHHLRHVSIEVARGEVERAAEGQTVDALALAEKLERATGCKIGTLVKLTKDWPA